MEIPAHILRELEINQKDIDVYIDLIEHGHSAASTIAVRTHIDRTTTYSVLKRLMNKGFIVKSTQNGITRYAALDPDVLEEKIVRDIEEKKRSLKNIQSFLPKIVTIKNQQNPRPSIQIFEGANGVISLYEFMLKNNKKQDAFLTIEKLPAPLKKYLTKDYIKKKVALGVKSRVLVQESARSRAYKKLDHKGNRNTKIIPKDQFPFETEIILGDHHIAIIDFQKELVGALINSKPTCNTLRALFELIWNNF